MQSILTAVSAGLGTLDRIYAPDGTVVGWGSDLACTDDVPPTFDTVSGADPLSVAQAAYRRLATALGELLDDPDYGCDLEAYLQCGMTPQQLHRIQAEVQAELLTDDRISDVEATLTKTSDTEYSLLVLAKSAQGPFSLTFELVDGQVALSAIQAEK